MTAKATCVSDAQARVVLPTGFANATLIIEQLSDIELRIRKADTTEANETQFAEEQITVLSDRDRDLFLEILEARLTQRCLASSSPRSTRTNMTEILIEPFDRAKHH